MAPSNIVLGSTRWSLDRELDDDAIYRSTTDSARLISVHRDPSFCDPEGLWSNGNEHTTRWLRHAIKELCPALLVSQRSIGDAVNDDFGLDLRVRFREGFLPAGTDVSAEWLDGGLLISSYADLPTLDACAGKLDHRAREYLLHRLAVLAVAMRRERLWHGHITADRVLVDTSTSLARPGILLTRPTACAEWSERSEIPKERDALWWLDLLVGLQLNEFVDRPTYDIRVQRLERVFDVGSTYVQTAMRGVVGNAESPDGAARVLDYFAETPPFMDTPPNPPPAPIVVVPQAVVAEPVPVVAEPAPPVAEPAPPVAEPVPEVAKPVPAVAEPVPAVAEPVQVPSTKNGSPRTGLVGLASLVAVAVVAMTWPLIVGMLTPPVNHDAGVREFLDAWRHDYERAHVDFDAHVAHYTGGAREEMDTAARRAQFRFYVRDTALKLDGIEIDCDDERACAVTLNTTLQRTPTPEQCTDEEVRKARAKNLRYCDEVIYTTRRTFTLTRSGEDEPWRIATDAIATSTERPVDP